MLLSLCLVSISLPTFAASRLGVEASPQSRDFVENRQQFQLHSLLTEQRHPRTRDLSEAIGADTAAGLAALLSVDEDVARTLDEVAGDPARMAQLRKASQAVQAALRDGHRIYFYGTGSTGRLAETLESGLWRPFWTRAAQSPAWPRIARGLPDIGERVRGEITGGDRALISSLEGFEDLPLIGELQLQDNGIGPQDVVFAVTEGGETSAVIGTALAAAAQSAGGDRVWFVYNNPDDLLLPFDRSRRVLQDPRIQKLALPTGPQAIAGSTRMQATTTSLYVLGVVLEDAIGRLLGEHLSPADMQALGFSASATLESRLRDFAPIQRQAAAAVQRLATWTDHEARAYAGGRHATYLARQALMPVFVDVTERAPTFRLAPLDRTDAPQRRSWIQVWTPTEDPADAWQALLQRPFRGLEPQRYRDAFERSIDDPYLRATALRSLEQAGSDQQGLYDLAVSPRNLALNGPQAGDLGVLVLCGEDELSPLQVAWLEAYAAAGAELVVFSVGNGPLPSPVLGTLSALPRPVPLVAVTVPWRDPLGLNRTIALKMLLNAHSSGVMAKLGRVVGNTMTAVQPGNLKLVGRATYLVQSHVNAVLAGAAWRERHGPTEPLSYAEANAVLFEAIGQRGELGGTAQAAEVELSVVAILEGLARQYPLSWPDAAAILDRQGLNGYLREYRD
ncbi:hypothetical protein [Pseudoxanthomonas putridarboris]